MMPNTVAGDTLERQLKLVIIRVVQIYMVNFKVLRVLLHKANFVPLFIKNICAKNWID
jgi:hypothetical protein